MKKYLKKYKKSLVRNEEEYYLCDPKRGERDRGGDRKSNEVLKLKKVTKTFG